MEDRHFFSLRNVLLLLGVVVTTVGLIYFATAFADVISDWGRVISLALLTVIYVSLGVHFAGTMESDPIVARPGWQWLRVATALYVLGLVSGFSSVIAFLVIDDVSRVVKVLVVLGLGLALIVTAAWWFRRREPEPGT